jgi:hypothetical protein
MLSTCTRRRVACTRWLADCTRALAADTLSLIEESSFCLAARVRGHVAGERLQARRERGRLHAIAGGKI